MKKTTYLLITILMILSTIQVFGLTISGPGTNGSSYTNTTPNYNQTPTCSNECSYGQKSCSGNYPITCGQYDSDSCYEWKSGSYCSNGCVNGACKMNTTTSYNQAINNTNRNQTSTNNNTTLYYNQTTGINNATINYNQTNTNNTNMNRTQTTNDNTSRITNYNQSFTNNTVKNYNNQTNNPQEYNQSICVNGVCLKNISNESLNKANEMLKLIGMELKLNTSVNSYKLPEVGTCKSGFLQIKTDKNGNYGKSECKMCSSMPQSECSLYSNYCKMNYIKQTSKTWYGGTKASSVYTGCIII